MSFLDYLDKHEEELNTLAKAPKKLEETTKIVYKKTTIKEVKKEPTVIRKVVKPTPKPEVKTTNRLAEHASAILDGIREGDFGGNMYSLENQQRILNGKESIDESTKQETRSYANDLLDGIPEVNHMAYIPPQPMPQYVQQPQQHYQQPVKPLNENVQEPEMPIEMIRMMEENRIMAQRMSGGMPPSF